MKYRPKDETGYGESQSDSGDGSAKDVYRDMALYQHDRILPAVIKGYSKKPNP